MSATCPSWCDQGSRPHTRHEVTLGTWSGVAQTGERRAVVAQLVVHGLGDEDAAPMLVLVDGLEQTDCTLEWGEAHEVGVALIGAWRRHRRATVPE